MPQPPHCLAPGLPQTEHFHFQEIQIQIQERFLTSLGPFFFGVITDKNHIPFCESNRRDVGPAGGGMAVLDLDDWQLVLILGGCGCFVLGLVLCYICAVMQRLSKELPSKLEDTYRSKAAVRGIRPALRARPARLSRVVYIVDAGRVYGARARARARSCRSLVRRGSF